MTNASHTKDKKQKTYSNDKLIDDIKLKSEEGPNVVVVVYHYQITKGQLEPISPAELTSAEKDRSTAECNEELLEILSCIKEQLTELDSSGKKLPAYDAKHFNALKHELDQVEEQLSQGFGGGVEAMKKLISDMFLFFTGQCEKFKSSFFRTKGRDPILEVLNKFEREHHYPRTIGSIFRNFLDDDVRNDIIKKKLGIDLNNGFSPFKLQELKLNTKPPMKKGEKLVK